MKVLEVYPKDVYVTLEFSLKQIDMILEFMDNSEVRYDSKVNPTLHEAVSYIKDEYMPKSEQLLKDMQQGG